MKFVIALVFCFAAVYCVEEKFFAVTPAPTDLRNEYDRVLIELSNDKARQAEELLLRLTRQLKELESTKSKELKERITLELDIAIPIMKASEVFLQAEVKRTDLDLVERFIFESAADNVMILVKQLTALEAKVKAMA